jgi:hypothetical protein
MKERSTGTQTETNAITNNDEDQKQHHPRIIDRPLLPHLDGLTGIDATRALKKKVLPSEEGGLVQCEDSVTPQMVELQAVMAPQRPEEDTPAARRE